MGRKRHASTRGFDGGSRFRDRLSALLRSASAVPAYPDAKITLEQPSGEKFKAGLYGDEWSGGYETLDGYAIEQDRKTERWEYAKRNSNGRLGRRGDLRH